MPTKAQALQAAQQALDQRTAQIQSNMPSAAPPSSASSQGLSTEDINRIKGVTTGMAEELDLTSAHQQGKKEQVPEITNAVSKDPLSSPWLDQWFVVLKSYGVSEVRSRFESSRLSREDFSVWATRRIEWVKATRK